MVKHGTTRGGVVNPLPATAGYTSSSRCATSRDALGAMRQTIRERLRQKGDGLPVEAPDGDPPICQGHSGEAAEPVVEIARHIGRMLVFPAQRLQHVLLRALVRSLIDQAAEFIRYVSWPLRRQEGER